MATGIVGWSAYLPYWRLTHEAVGAALGAAPGRGSRAVACHDEDATSMAVEAARPLVRAGASPEVLLLATSSPPYLDKTNAAAVHAGLDLAADAAAYDVGGATRSGIGALRAADAMARGGEQVLVALSDLRTGLPGGTEEGVAGDGAAAFLVGTERVVAEIAAHGHGTTEVLDRWRAPGALAASVWEERFAEQVLVDQATRAVDLAVKAAGISAADLDHVLVAGSHLRATRRVIGTIGARPDAAVPDLVDAVGASGAAHAGVLLCHALDRAAPGQWILVVSVADGADAFLLRTTPALTAAQTSRREHGALLVEESVAGGRADLSYADYLTWRELLPREAARRPDPAPPAAPPSYRTNRWKFGFVGSRCDGCGTVHLPPVRVCLDCRSVDSMTPERLADRLGTVVTYTVDRLAASLSPPVVAAVIDFDGGGRFSCELTDLRADEARIGLRVEMTFRRLFTAGGVHNYFWKAKPVRTETAGRT